MLTFLFVSIGLGLWGIVHNAGVLGYVADGELLPISVYKQCMDVNFIGVVQVTKMFMPLLRKAKGRLVTISSMAGKWFTQTCAKVCLKFPRTVCNMEKD